MSPKKEQQFKLNYFDIIKGVLFPSIGRPAPKAAPKPAPTALPAEGTASQGTPPATMKAPSAPVNPAHPVNQSTPAIIKPAAPTYTPAVVQPKPNGNDPATLQPIKKLSSPAKKNPAMKLPRVQKEKIAPAFWTTASILSVIVNIILIVVIVILARQLFALKTMVGDNLLGGLYENFILMDKAHIKTNITVQDNIPVQFSLPISQDTTVTLTEPTRINGAQVAINSGGLSINAPANIVLPAGTNLPVHLELTVPVQTTIPITLNVPVDIPLDQTELHTPFVGLQQVVHPLYYLLQPQIDKPDQLPGCSVISPFCNWFFNK